MPPWYLGGERMRYRRALMLWRLYDCIEPAPEPRIDAGNLSVCLCSVSAILCPDEAG